MLKKIAYHLGITRWHRLDDFIAPLTRIQDDLQSFAARSEQRAKLALAAHLTHLDNHKTSTAILGNLRRLTEIGG